MDVTFAHYTEIFLLIPWMYMIQCTVVHDMDNIYHHASSEAQQPSVYNGGYLETPYTANRPPPGSAAHEPTQPDHTAPRWTPSQGYDSSPFGYNYNFPAPAPGGGGFGGPPLAPPYGFDPSVPPPPFGCPPPRHFPNMVTTTPINTYSSGGASTFQTLAQHFRPGPQTTRYDLDSSQKHEYEDLSESGALPGYPLFPPQDKDHDRSPGTTTRPEDEAAIQRRQDQQWLGRFLQHRDKTPRSPQTQPQQPQHSSAPDLTEALYRAAQLVSQLAESCETLRNNVEDECVWADSYLMALNVKTELQDKLIVLSDSSCLDSLKTKSSRIAKRRARRLRARKLQQMEEKDREDRITEKETGINKWRMEQIHQVEERKKVNTFVRGFKLVIFFFSTWGHSSIKQSHACYHLIKLFIRKQVYTSSRQSNINPVFILL